jgi:hypothetical protein
MLSYLSMETAYIRVFGNRSLLLLFLCALSRTGDKLGNASVLGLSLNINPGVIVVYGPLLIFLLLVALRSESDALLTAREVVLDEASELPARARRIGLAVYALFLAPVACAIFLVVQFFKAVIPSDESCDGFNRLRQFFDLSWIGGTPSIYCIQNVKDGMPWIYPPFQAYVYALILGASAYLTLAIARNWAKARGAGPARPGRQRG